MPSLRKNVLYLTPQEKVDYLNALWKLKNTTRPGSVLNIYDEYALLHRTATQLQWNKQEQDVGHNAADSLPWHRALLAQFEAELQKMNPNVTLVYWDFTDVKSVQAAFSDDFMGAWIKGDNLPLRGPLKNWTRVKLKAEDELTIREYQVATPQDYVNVMNLNPKFKLQTMIEDYPNYKEFGEKLNGVHGATHFIIGGNHGDQTSLLTAVNDPCFWMIHTFMDFFWTVWQDRHSKYASLHHQFYVEQDPSGKEKRPSKQGLNENDIMWPWDNDKHKFEVEIPSEGAMLEKFLIEIRKTPTITVASQWNYRASKIGYEIQGERKELVIGYETKFDLGIRQSIIFTLRVPEELHNSPFFIHTTGEPKLVMRIYGPANCDDCYGPLSCTDDGNGPEGPQVTQVFAKGKYHVIVHPMKSTDDVDVFGIKVEVLYGPEDPPYIPPSHPLPPLPPFGTGVPLPPGGMPFGAGPPFGPGVVPFRHGIPPPGGFPPLPALLRPPAYGPVGNFVAPPVPVLPATRYIPITFGVSRQCALPLHGAFIGFFFAVDKNSRVAVGLKGIPVANVVLKKDDTVIEYTATSGNVVNAIVHKQVTPGNYYVVVYSQFGVPGRFTIIVQATAV